MVHFSKYKLLIFLIAGITAVNSLSAQSDKKDPAILFAEFISTDTLLPADKIHTNTCFICRVDPKEIKRFKKNDAIHILRQLNDSVFIISFKDKKGVAVNKFSFPWLKQANDNWKMSPPLLLQKTSSRLLFPATFFVSVYQPDLFTKKTSNKNIRINNTVSQNVFVVAITSTQAFDELLKNEQVFFIAAKNPAKEELQINDLDLSINKINGLHSKNPFLTGNGITISIKENIPDTTDIDYTARYIYNPLESGTPSSHASIMATMAAGAGNSWYLGRGVANGAIVTSSDFSNLLPDPDSNYRRYHISVQNHSYGVGVENFYGADAAAFDSSALKNDTVVFIFSAGNSGNATPSSGNYMGILDHANLTGSFKMAKNIITVGAVDSFNQVAAASSRGPGYDGRVKPEMVAYGEDGTSGATALVSGTVAILQQAYKTGTGKLPPAALIKSILLNSADDVGPAGIDYSSGYGNLNALKAAEDLLGARYFSGSVQESGSKSFSFNMPANIGKAKFTLVWQDKPAESNTYKALVNDLDMELQFPSSAQSWKPWVLNSFADTASLNSLPVRKRDSLNNVEQITLDNPAEGTYKIVVNGFNVTGNDQPFYIAYQLDTINYFSWDFPAATDNIFPGVPNMIRYNTDILSNTARAMYSIDNGITWSLLDSLVNTARKYFYWNAPDTNALAILKMRIGAMEFLSDTFTLSKKLDFKVGFNCTDSVLWYWNKLPGINSYQLFSLPGAYLQPVALVTDTQYVFKKANMPYLQFAVAPMINGRAAVKSYTTDYTNQGVDCYVNNFLADLQNATAKIQLQLGTEYLIKAIVFEKLQQNNFVSFEVVNNISGLNYQVTDNKLQKGINTYRARIELVNGKVIYSSSTSIFYFSNSATVIFPNPVLQDNNVTIQFKDLQNQVVKISDVSGRVVFKQQMTSNSVSVPFRYVRGLYFITIINSDTHTFEVYKAIVY